MNANQPNRFNKRIPRGGAVVCAALTLLAAASVPGQSITVNRTVELHGESGSAASASGGLRVETGGVILNNVRLMPDGSGENLVFHAASGSTLMVYADSSALSASDTRVWIFGGEGTINYHGSITNTAANAEGVSLIKEGTSTLYLDGDNRYIGPPRQGDYLNVPGDNRFQGDAILRNGTVMIGHDNSLGAGTIELQATEPGSVVRLQTDLDWAGNFSILPVRTLANPVRLTSTTGRTILGAGGTGTMIFTGDWEAGSGPQTLTVDGVRVDLAGNLTKSGNPLTKDGRGTLRLLGDASGLAETLQVAEGSVVIDGTLGNGGGNVVVAEDASLGGNGTITGTLTLQSGAGFAFDPDSTLTVDGATADLGNLSIEHVSGIEPRVISGGTYQLLDGTAHFDTTQVQNIGEGQKVSYTDTFHAWFEVDDGLKLVVDGPIIYPEGTWTGEAEDNLLNTALNWADGLVPGAGATATFRGVQPGDLNLSFNADVNGGGTGFYLRLRPEQSNSVTIVNSAAGTRDFRLRDDQGENQTLILQAGSGEFSLGASGTAATFSIGSGAGDKTATLVNDSDHTAIFGSQLGWQVGGGQACTYVFTGSGSGGFEVLSALNNSAHGQRPDLVGATVNLIGGASLTLSGNNSALGGAFAVQAGTLRVNNASGSGTGTGTVTVGSGAAIGGSGTIGGELVLQDGARLAISSNATLTVHGATADLGNLAIDDLDGLETIWADGSYQILDGSASFDTSRVQNLGEAHGVEIAPDFKVWFVATNGLQLVVNEESEIVDPLPPAPDGAWLGTSNNNLNVAANWQAGSVPTPGTTALFGGYQAGDLNLIYTSNFGGGTGLLVEMNEHQKGNVTLLNSGADWIRFLHGSSMTIANGAGAFTVGDEDNTGRIVLGSGTTPRTYTFVNNSGHVATFGPKFTWIYGGNHAATAEFSGTGNWRVAGPMIDQSTHALAVKKSGEGTLTLTGNNSYTGATTVDDGTLVVGHNNALGTGTVTLGASGRLTADEEDRTVANTINNHNTAILGKADAGRLILSGDWVTGTQRILRVGGEAELTGKLITQAGGTDVRDVHGGGTLIISSDQSQLEDAPRLFYLTHGIVRARHDRAFGIANRRGISIRNFGEFSGQSTLELENGVTITAGEGYAGPEDGIALQGRTLSGTSPTHWVHVRNFSGANALENLRFRAGGGDFGIESASGLLSVNSFHGSSSATGDEHLYVSGEGDTVFHATIGAIGNLIKTGDGTLTISGNSNHAGTTAVNGGTLLVEGALSGAGTVTVANGAAIGGNGSVGGNLHLDAGAEIFFDPEKTLGVGGTVTFAEFGIADLQGLDSSVATGTYTVVAGTVHTHNLSNLGEEGKVSLGDDKVAWFETGSLHLVVAEGRADPEPFDITDVTISMDSGNAVVEVVFDSTGHAYTLQQTTNLVSALWQDVAWGDSPLRYTNDTAQGFFRIKAE